jgi:hypothetical protein
MSVPARAVELHPIARSAPTLLKRSRAKPEGATIRQSGHPKTRSNTTVLLSYLDMAENNLRHKMEVEKFPQSRAR